MRILKLDGLRGIFSLMIVFLHYDPRILPNFLGENFIVRQSWIFVEFFFVLSGYVISFNYSKIETIDLLKTFVKKRFIRLYPLLLFSTLLFFLFESFSNVFLINHINSPESVGSLFYKTIDTLFLTNSTPIFGSGGGMNAPSWSISSEMISYLVFGVIIFIFQPKYRSLIFVFIVLLSGFFQFTLGDLDLDLRFLRGTLSFSLGVLLYKINNLKFRVPNYFELIIPIIVIWSMYLINLESEFNKIHRIVTINFVFFVSIGILLKTNGFISKFLEERSIQYLGKISYSIYLNHLIIITIFSRSIFSLMKIDQTITSQLLVFIISIVLVLFYSNFTFKNIELKIGRFLKNILLTKST
jgi:peptidoglycan/LPS O-acetylase OafA/YrhL